MLNRASCLGDSRKIGDVRKQLELKMNCRHIFTWGHIHKCSSCRPVVGLLACLVLTIVYVIFILMTYQYTVDDEVLGPSAWSKDTTQGSEITPQFKYTERVSQQENVKNQDVSVNPSAITRDPSYERPEEQLCYIRNWNYTRNTR